MPESVGNVDREAGRSLAREYARTLYNSKAWQRTRNAYKRMVGGLCEVCYANGIVKPGEIVHHKIPVTPDNINDPEITLSFTNLQCVCRECHAEIHDGQYDRLRERKRRYKIADDGRVIFNG